MKSLLLIAISILSVGCGTQLGSDLDGLAGGLEGLAGGLMIALALGAGIAIVIVGALGAFLGSSIGWNLTRNSKEDPDKIERSERNQRHWWYRLMISFGFGIGGVALMFLAFKLYRTFFFYENDFYFSLVILLGFTIGAIAAFWLQKKINAKRKIKGDKGIASMVYAGMFYGPILLTIVVSVCGIPIVSLSERNAADVIPAYLEDEAIREEYFGDDEGTHKDQYVIGLTLLLITITILAVKKYPISPYVIRMMGILRGGLNAETTPEPEGVNLEELDIRQGLAGRTAYMKGSDTLYTGEAYKLRRNGQRKEEMNFKDGKEDGLSLSWHKNGQKKGEANWKDGKRISAKFWNSKGEPVG